MLIYEKENKLNINFDNEVSEQPDLQISKEDGKTSVKIDGQESGGGSEPFIVTITGTLNIGEPITYTYTIDKTLEEIISAINNRLNVLCYAVFKNRILVLTDIDKSNSSVTFSRLGNINAKVGGGYGLDVEKFTITDEGVTHTRITVDAQD